MARFSRVLAALVAGASLGAVAVAAVATPAGAQGIFEGDFFSEGLFAGGGVGYLRTKNDIEINGFEFDGYKDSAFEVWVRGGKRFGDSGAMNSFAAYVSYTYQSSATGGSGGAVDYESSGITVTEAKLLDKSFEWSAHKFAIGADWTPRLVGQLSGVLGVYAGLAYVNADYSARMQVETATAGVAGWTDNGASNYRDNTGKFKGFYGVRVGAALEIDAQNALELALKYEQISPNMSNVGFGLSYIYSF